MFVNDGLMGDVMGKGGVALQFERVEEKNIYPLYVVVLAKI